MKMIHVPRSSNGGQSSVCPISTPRGFLIKPGIALVAVIFSLLLYAAAAQGQTVDPTCAAISISSFQPVVDNAFTGSDDGWTFKAYGSGFTNATPTTSGPGTTGIGFVVSNPITLENPSRCMYGLWTSPTNIPGGSAQAGMVYRATAALESTAASPDTAPGFRLRYFNQGYTHQGYMISESVQLPLSGDVANVPYAGNPFTAKLFWAPRPDLGDMGDSEGQAQIPDLRTYRVAWEIIGWTGEVGTLTMESFLVESFARPPTTTKAVAWGSGAGEIPFNAPDYQGGMRSRDSVGGFAADGSIAATAANAVITLTGAEKTMRYVGIKPSWQAALVNVKPVSNHLYRFSATLACGSRTAIPTYRICVNSQLVPSPPAVQLGAMRNIAWLDWYSFCDVIGSGGKQTSFKLPGQAVCPFAPETTGSVIDTYVYSHNVAAASAGTTIFVPILSSVDTGYYGTGTVWADPVTPMTWSAASWEDLGAGY